MLYMIKTFKKHLTTKNTVFKGKMQRKKIEQ